MSGGSLGNASPSLVPPSPDAPPAAPRFDVSYLAQRDALVDGFTRKYVTALLEHTRGNQSEAARIAGLDRTYLGRMMGRLGVGRSK